MIRGSEELTQSLYYESLFRQDSKVSKKLTGKLKDDMFYL